MLRRVAPTLLALACAASSAGCRWAYTGSGSGPGSGGVAGGAGPATEAEGVDAVVSALNSFTEVLLSKVETAQDRRAGVAEAQALLDARGGELAARISAVKRGAREAGARGRWLEAEVDNTDRVHRLQLRYADEAARDPELKGRLDRLVADYDALFASR